MNTLENSLIAQKIEDKTKALLSKNSKFISSSVCDSDSDDEVLRMISNTKNYIQNYCFSEIHKPLPKGNRYIKKNYSIHPGYVCKRCGLKDHHVKFCPTNGDSTFNI